MFNITRLTVSAVIVLASFCAILPSLAEQHFTAPEGVALLTEQEIRDALIGNTAHYPEGSLEFCRPSGSCFGKRVGFEWDGTWSLNGPVICFKYPELPRSGGCRFISRRDDGKLDFYDADTGKMKFEGVRIYQGRKYL